MAIAGFLSKQTGKSQSLAVIFVIFSNNLEDGMKSLLIKAENDNKL